MGWAGCIARTGGMRNAYKILVGKLEAYWPNSVICIAHGYILQQTTGSYFGTVFLDFPKS
jgi:hypothetical protein